MEEITKTGYEWSLEANIRLLNLGEYETYEDEYFVRKITSEAFYERLSTCTVKPNSQPRKTEKFLELRMYGLVPYNMSPIQQAIQFGHAVVRYGRSVRDMGVSEKTYNRWADVHETFIILNGGTINDNPDKLGTLNKHLSNFREAGILVQPFYEPDLGDQLTAFCFLVDERVFNKTLYPDFIPESLPWSRRKPNQKQLDELAERNKQNYGNWVEKIGGIKNAFLREYLKPLKLA